jgi:hypothetical protein
MKAGSGGLNPVGLAIRKSGGRLNAKSGVRSSKDLEANVPSVGITDAKLLCTFIT